MTASSTQCSRRGYDYGEHDLRLLHDKDYDDDATKHETTINDDNNCDDTNQLPPLGICSGDTRLMAARAQAFVLQN